MPTARELLDQADALMRRNRSLARDDIPVLTEAVLPEAAAQLMQSGHLAESFAEPRERFDVPPAASDVLDDVPVLTDVVEEIEALSILDPIEPEGEPSAWLDFDDDGTRSIIDAVADSIVVVPDIATPEPGRGATDVERDFDRELQPAGRDDGTFAEPQPAHPDDAAAGVAEITAQPVETIFAEKIAEADEAVIAEKFTPSWDEALAEETTPQSNEPAVIEESAAHADEANEQPTALDDEVVKELTAPVDQAVDEPTSPEAGVAEEAATHADEPVVIEAFAPQPDEPVVIEVFAPQPDEPIVTEALAPQPDEPIVTEAFAPQPDEPAVLEEAVSQPGQAAGVEAIDLQVQPAIEETTAPATALLAHDDARWTAMAEEIRMQVLQRIDLFTDIGLREQLGLHLKPIVDRAGAELVATINREVGELLRAYVAETIEREIERWRRESGEIR